MPDSSFFLKQIGLRTIKLTLYFSVCHDEDLVTNFVENFNENFVKFLNIDVIVYHCLSDRRQTADAYIFLMGS